MTTKYYRDLPAITSTLSKHVFGVCKEYDSNIKILNDYSLYEASAISQYAFYSAQKIAVPQNVINNFWIDIVTDEPLVFRSKEGASFTPVGFTIPYDGAYYANIIIYFDQYLVWDYTDVCYVRLYNDPFDIAESKQDMYQTGVKRYVSLQIDTIVNAEEGDVIKPQVYLDTTTFSRNIYSYYTIYRVI